MSNYYEETMRNGERYYEKCSHNYSAKMLDGGGFTTEPTILLQESMKRLSL